MVFRGAGGGGGSQITPSLNKKESRDGAAVCDADSDGKMQIDRLFLLTAFDCGGCFASSLPYIFLREENDLLESDSSRKCTVFPIKVTAKLSLVTNLQLVEYVSL